MNRATWPVGVRAGAVVGVAVLVAGCTTNSKSGAKSTSSAAGNGSGSATVAAAGAGVATGAQFCKGMKIVFFPGGTAGGGFETVVYNGAKAAAAALGANVTYEWSDWDPNKMITQFQAAVATKPDGIAVMGHPGDSAFDPLIDQAESQGITVTVMNTELPKAEAKYAAQGTGYAGARCTTREHRSPTPPSSVTSWPRAAGSSCGVSKPSRVAASALKASSTP